MKQENTTLFCLTQSLAIFVLLAASTGAVQSAQDMPTDPSIIRQWNFDKPDGWYSGGQVAAFSVKDGTLRAKMGGCINIIQWEGEGFAAGPRQYITIRLKTPTTGLVRLYWHGNGKVFSEDYTQQVSIPGGGQWRTIAIIPGWHNEERIDGLRLDPYELSKLEIDWVRVQEWPAGARDGAKPASVQQALVFPLAPDAPYLMCKSDTAVSNPAWACVEARSKVKTTAYLVWTGRSGSGLRRAAFTIEGDDKRHPYNIDLAGFPELQSEILFWGVEIPLQAMKSVSIESCSLSHRPRGRPDIVCKYFGFADGINREGRECTVLAKLVNNGGDMVKETAVSLTLPRGTALVDDGFRKTIGPLESGEQIDVLWNVRVEREGSYDLSLTMDQGLLIGSASLRFLPEIDLPKADYVLPPRPVKTTKDVLSFYWPGWSTYTSWNCLRLMAPERKPVLGWFDEANPETVDWQIKWAVENGITGYVVDWYWDQGTEVLAHWLDGYRKARYRDNLKVALMWVNHPPYDNHSVEDTCAAARVWVEKYFSLPSYYRVGKRPVVVMWDTAIFRDRLGGSDKVKEALDACRKIARDAGHDRIMFVAHHLSFGGYESARDMGAFTQQLKDEGYEALVSYHEWGSALSTSPDFREVRYDDVVTSAPRAWNSIQAGSKIPYCPVVDTGWDSTPISGTKSLVFRGRSPKSFEKLLRSAADFVKKNDPPFVMLGPTNELSEGSYILPCTDFGFGMYESVRRVFGIGDPKSWPMNHAPSDVGFGPYDVPPPSQALDPSWDFENGMGGWTIGHGVSDLRQDGGRLRFTSGSSPAIVVATDFKARRFDRMLVRMKITAENSPADNLCILYWGSNGSELSENRSARVPVQMDGEFHEYVLNLGDSPAWRGKITMLRFDACRNVPGAKVEIDEIRLGLAR